MGHGHPTPKGSLFSVNSTVRREGGHLGQWDANLLWFRIGRGHANILACDVQCHRQQCQIVAAQPSEFQPAPPPPSPKTAPQQLEVDPFRVVETKQFGGADTEDVTAEGVRTRPAHPAFEGENGANLSATFGCSIITKKRDKNRGARERREGVFCTLPKCRHDCSRLALFP